MYEFLVGSICFVAWFVILILIGRWILNPIDRAALRSQDPMKFSTADFLALILVIQIPLVCVRVFYADGQSAPTTILYLLGIGTALAIWFSGVSALCRAQIRRGLHRVLFIAFVLPITYYGIFVFTTLLTIAVGALLVGTLELYRRELFQGLAVVTLLFAGFAASAWITRRIVVLEDSNPAEIPEPNSFEDPHA